MRRCQGRVFALAYHYLRDREEARDAAQETFIRIYQGLEAFEGGERFMAWMVRVARNCCIDRLRRRKARPQLDGPPLNERGDARHPGPGPEATAIARDRRRLVYRALDRMTDINREMILLKEIQGLQQQEIADMLAIPLGTVKARSNRARLELARRILEIDPSYGA